MLKLPSLDLVFSSNRGELETPAGAHPADGSHPPSSTPPGQHVPKLPPSKGNCGMTPSCVQKKRFARLTSPLHEFVVSLDLCFLSYLCAVVLSSSSSSSQHRHCWEAPWAGAATAAASLTSPAPPAPPRASASPPACPTSRSMCSIPTAPASRSLPSPACLRAQGR